VGWGQKVIPRPSADYFVVGRRQKLDQRLRNIMNGYSVHGRPVKQQKFPTQGQQRQPLVLRSRVALQASKMHRLDENGYLVFTYPNTNSAIDTVKDFRQALKEEQHLQDIFRNLFQVPSAFFEGKGLWENIIEASQLPAFMEFYDKIKHDRTLGPLWRHDYSWHCVTAILCNNTPMEANQWLCQLAALQNGERVDSDLIFYTYIRHSIWTSGNPE
jgi:hypothetical protein